MGHCLRVLIGLTLAFAWASVQADTPPQSTDDLSTASPLYMLTYDHGGLVLWGRDHFVEHLRTAVEWLDRYPSFKIGLDNEAYTYDQLAEQDPVVIEQIRGYLDKYKGRFGKTTVDNWFLTRYPSRETRKSPADFRRDFTRHPGCQAVAGHDPQNRVIC